MLKSTPLIRCNAKSPHDGNILLVSTLAPCPRPSRFEISMQTEVRIAPRRLADESVLRDPCPTFPGSYLLLGDAIYETDRMTIEIGANLGVPGKT